MNWCRYGQLIENSRIVLNILQYVNHTKRKANIVARKSTKEALNLPNEQIHVEKAPLCAHDIVSLECFDLD
jgi:hypothetical protein